MPPGIIALVGVSVLAAVAFLDAVAYLDDGTTLFGLLYSRLTAQTDS
jgi:hypothetical protein